ncbi:hypothetical protein [Exiguobacterium sp. s57]|uniref:hypothetical protein n=1 Tax=Exiguobacterium sp. s57 TaxID=2751258 RepID=UPI001BE56835|nr:hypothetical protein [Exiguobacterium sp. s57]
MNCPIKVGHENPTFLPLDLLDATFELLLVGQFFFLLLGPSAPVLEPVHTIGVIFFRPALDLVVRHGEYLGRP